MTASACESDGITVERLGDCAVRVARPPGSDARRVLAAIRSWPGVVDAAITEAWIGIYFAAPTSIPADLGQLPLGSLGAPGIGGGAARAGTARTIEIVVRYDGADLEDVARELRLDPEQVVQLHSASLYSVLFLGFLPGFAYLGGLPERLVVSRRASPRPRVPKGAVAIAGPYSGVYPCASAGGWRLLGTTLATPDALFGAAGALLQPGDHVRFRRAP